MHFAGGDFRNFEFFHLYWATSGGLGSDAAMLTIAAEELFNPLP